MRLALYQPDIPQNAGAILRLAACLGVPLEVIEPCGFVWSDRRMKRAGMDYMDRALVTRHVSWQEFRGAVSGRVVLSSTRGVQCYADFTFRGDDILLFGRETAGVPDQIHAAADAELRIPMVDGARSLNVALAAAMVLGEALRQQDGFPGTAAA